MTDSQQAIRDLLTAVVTLAVADASAGEPRRSGDWLLANLRNKHLSPDCRFGDRQWIMRVYSGARSLADARFKDKQEEDE
jgi:hypothetical protein